MSFSFKGKQYLIWIAEFLVTGTMLYKAINVSLSLGFPELL